MRPEVSSLIWKTLSLIRNMFSLIWETPGLFIYLFVFFSYTRKEWRRAQPIRDREMRIPSQEIKTPLLCVDSMLNQKQWNYSKAVCRTVGGAILAASASVGHASYEKNLYLPFEECTGCLERCSVWPDHDISARREGRFWWIRSKKEEGN